LDFVISYHLPPDFLLLILYIKNAHIFHKQ